MQIQPPRPQLAAALAALALVAGPARGGLPPEDECPAVTGLTGPNASADGGPMLLKEGMILRRDDLMALRSFIPRDIWHHREQFFFEGMRLEIGPCHRRYPVPQAFREATERFADAVRLDRDGNLRDYVAGLPFPPERIDLADDDAGIRWAWNLEHRNRGAGHFGSFRLVDLPGRLGGVQVYRGSFFFLQTRHRADLASSGYALPEADGESWVAGGRFDEPTNARHLAWRQFRPSKAERRYRESDNTFVYVPTMRKQRRAATSWIDGVFMPRYSTSGDGSGGGIPIGTTGLGGGGAINPTAGESIQTTEDSRRGFTGMALRPNAYVWRINGERTVLAPLNAARAGYPLDPDRNYGPSGLSVVSDRWDVRHAVIIEGAARMPGEGIRTITYFVDYQTQQPLYAILRGSKRRLLEIGILVHRFSGDTLDYPEWPGGTRALVFDPVAAVFFNAGAGAGGWRRESYDVTGIPPSASAVRRMTSSVALTRGH